MIWLNELQDNISSWAEKDDEEDDAEITLPEYKPLIRQTGFGVLKDLAITAVRNIYEQLASYHLQPRIAWKLLKGMYPSLGIGIHHDLNCWDRCAQVGFKEKHAIFMEWSNTK